MLLDGMAVPSLGFGLLGRHDSVSVLCFGSHFSVSYVFVILGSACFGQSNVWDPGL